MEYFIEEGYPGRIPELEALFQAIDGFSLRVFDHAILGRPGLVGCYAFDGASLIGCKIGFSPRPLYFESWVGGVLPEYRNKGVASELVKLQHKWCMENGYRYVETIVANDNLPMQIVNLKSGMTVVGAFLDKGSEVKLKFQKSLTF